MQIFVTRWQQLTVIQTINVQRFAQHEKIDNLTRYSRCQQKNEEGWEDLKKGHKQNYEYPTTVVHTAFDRQVQRSELDTQHIAAVWYYTQTRILGVLL